MTALIEEERLQIDINELQEQHATLASNCWSLLNAGALV